MGCEQNDDEKGRETERQNDGWDDKDGEAEAYQRGVHEGGVESAAEHGFDDGLAITHVPEEQQLDGSAIVKG